MNQAMPLAQQRLATPGSAETRPIMPEPRIVPFDYQVKFDLTGRRDNVITRLINVSFEGNFVAVAMGYSFQPAPTITFPPLVLPSLPKPDDPPSREFMLQGVTIGLALDGFRMTLRDVHKVAPAKHEELEQQLLKTGVQVNPMLADLVSSQGGGAFFVDSLGFGIRNLFQTATCEHEQLNFLYRIIDDASSREFQSEPVHNIAGLGIANGDRPFRFFPQPIVFEPRAVIRIQIIEISGLGRLFFVLQGYKVLGTGRRPLEAAQKFTVGKP